MPLAGGEEETLAYVDWEAAQLVIDGRRSSLSAEGSLQKGRLEPFGNTVDLHLYLGGSVLEVIADGRHALNTRVYPSRDDSLAVHLIAYGGQGVVSLGAWPLTAIW